VLGSPKPGEAELIFLRNCNIVLVLPVILMLIMVKAFLKSYSASELLGYLDDEKLHSCYLQV
jgi:hypothetical protein